MQKAMYAEIIYLTVPGDDFIDCWYCNILRHSSPWSGLSKKYEGESESLRIPFFEVVYGFRVSFLSMCIFERVNYISWQFRGPFVVFTKIFALKMSVKSVTVAFIVKYICKIK